MSPWIHFRLAQEFVRLPSPASRIFFSLVTKFILALLPSIADTELSAGFRMAGDVATWALRERGAFCAWLKGSHLRIGARRCRGRAAHPELANADLYGVGEKGRGKGVRESFQERFGRPRELVVDSSPSCFATLITQSSFPKGRPSCALERRLSSSDFSLSLPGGPVKRTHSCRRGLAC